MPMLLFGHPSRLILAGATLAIVAGCGSKAIDPADAKQMVRERVENTGAGTPKAVDCPDEIEAKDESTFKCRATLPRGGALTFTVKINNIEDGRSELTVVGVKVG